MSSIKEIVQLEGDRSEPSQYRVVHLFHEGSFLRAYDWSAWLLCRYVHEFIIQQTIGNILYKCSREKGLPAIL